MFQRTIKIGSIDYVSGQKKTLEIPRDGVLLQLNLRVQYTVTNDASGPAAPLFQALARIIRRVDLVMGGRDTVVSQSGEMLSARAQYEFAALPDGMGDTVVLTDSAATVYDVTIPIPRWLPRSRTILATADDLRRVSQATVEITWAGSDTSAMFGTPDGSVISLVTCTVEAEYLMDVPGDQGFNVRQLSEISEDVTATNDNLAVTIDGQTGLLVRSIMTVALDDGVGANTIVNKKKIQAASLVFHDNDGGQIQAANKLMFAQENLITGVYYRPLTFGGELSQAINTDPQVIPADINSIFDDTK